MCAAKIPMNELKEAFHKDVISYGHVPTRNEQNEHGTYTGHTYANRFGSWNTALKELGYPVHKHPGLIELNCFNCGKIIKKEHNQVKDRDHSFCSKKCVHQAKSNVECTICGTEFEAHYTNALKENSYCSHDCRKKSRLGLYQCDNCGDLFKADRYTRRLYSSDYCSEQCGYEGQANTREEVLEAFELGVKRLGTDAGLHEVMAAGGMGGGQYYKHFESLNEIARECGYDEMCGSWIVECENCGKQFQRIRSQVCKFEHQFCNQACYFEWARSGGLRKYSETFDFDYGPNWNHQKRAARARDNYRCKSCGISESEHKTKFGQRLEVHHIKKARKFDDYKKRNDLSNLLTLCRQCHVKWEHLPVRPQLAD
jgi:hypothetical protein